MKEIKVNGVVYRIGKGANLRDADLSGANLRDADLSDANLSGADLRGADLRDADLRGANLGSADLRGANLGGADLRGANLRGADLGGADLRDADLGGADLRGANLRGADLRGAKNIFTQGPLGSRGDILYAVKSLRGNKVMFKTGCFWGNGDELLKAANETHGIGSRFAIQYQYAVSTALAVLDALPKEKEKK